MRQPTILITGASQGLGAAIAQAAARLSATVVLAARSADALQAVSAQITVAGGTAHAIPGDVSSATDCQRMIAETLHTYGRLDAIVNNAGTAEPLARLDAVDPVAWDRLQRINVTGPVMLTQAALPALRQATINGGLGRVINISSGATIRPKAGWGAYCASKAALNMFSRVLALEEPAIMTLAVRPGAIDTAMQRVIREQGQGIMAQKDYERYNGLYERGELVQTKDPARAIAVLALHAPLDWSGQNKAWNDAPVQALVTEKLAR